MALIYIVEDNEVIQKSVRSYLELEDHEVMGFQEITHAKRAVHKKQPQLMLLDIILPDGNGLKFAKELFKQYSFSIIFLSARESESDRITGLELGADDYICKPFSPRELVLRVAAVLKRSHQKQTDQHQTWFLNGDTLRTDENSHQIFMNNQPLRLTVAEWKILQYLTAVQGSVASREQILNHCLDYNFEGYDRTVDTHIKNLRSKLGNANWIETIRGYGYRFIGHILKAEEIGA